MAKGKWRAKLKSGKYVAMQKGTSIYFLLWSAFSLMALVIVALFAFSQHYVLRNTYEQEMAKSLAEKGKQIETFIDRAGLNGIESEEYSAFVRYLGTANDVDVYIITAGGKVLAPKESGVENEELDIRDDFRTEMDELLPKLQENEGRSVIYSNGREYVYGARLANHHGQPTYLYVCRSLVFINAVMGQMTARIVLIAVFVFLLSFAVSSAISGVLVKPIVSMTEKTRRFARGDFEVDFMEGAYGGEIVALAQTLNFARDEISKADKMQKELIANVSHDFKTPLTMIKAYASMIREISGDIPEKRNKHAQVIEEEADRLASLVNDVLDLSKIRSGIDSLKITEFDLSAYVFDVLDRFTYLSETKGYKFVVDVEDGLYTAADELKIGQVLYNLIGNAVNYTGEDKKVYVSLKKERGGVRFAVRDTGKGIKQEELSTIWDRYYRSAETHKRPVKGTGLGLSIVKSILERHGFIFGVDSAEGKGSTFYVVFPCDDKI